MSEREQQLKPNILVVDRNDSVPELVHDIFKNEFNTIGFDRPTKEAFRVLKDPSTRLVIISFSALTEKTNQFLGKTFADMLRNYSNPLPESGLKKRLGVILYTGDPREYEMSIAAKYLDAYYLRKPAPINEIEKAIKDQLSKLKES